MWESSPTQEQGIPALETDRHHVTVLDFSRSFMTFSTSARQGSNIARIQLDATCRIEGWGDDADQDYVLIAPCRSEYMYRDGPLFQMPNYEFSGIFTEDEVVLLRTHWTSEAEAPEYAKAVDRFDRVAIDRSHMNAELLVSVEDIVEATLANRRLVARTTIQDAASGTTAMLEYPIKTMNVTTDPGQFQVDTGPLIVPDFSSTKVPHILRFAVAHIVYCSFDRSEFILRRPHVVGERDQQPVSVTDYSEVIFASAEHQMWAEIV